MAPTPGAGRRTGVLMIDRSMTPDDFAQLFGTTPEEVVSACPEVLNPERFRYRRLEPAERDALILRVLHRIDDEAMPSAGPDRKSDWEQGWSENLRDFIASGLDPETLIPRYYRKNGVYCRIGGDYAYSLSDHFVHAATHTFRQWLFFKYCADREAIYEFGCGTGHHLYWLGRTFPGKRLYGFDWASASQEILARMRAQLGICVEGRSFDFLHPAQDIVLEAGAAVFTFGALEQIGNSHGPFLRFLLERKPGICINVEGLHELYDPDKLPDFLALKYHTRRNYLSGYLTALRRIEQEGKIRILAVHHQQFGNMYDDPHSFVVWQPLANR